MTIIIGMRVLLWSFLTGTGDFENIEGTSATISGVGDSVFPKALRTFKLLSFGVHGSRIEKRWNLQFAVQRKDSVYTFIKIYLVNELRDT